MDAEQAPMMSDALIRYRRDITPTKKGAIQEHNRIGQILAHRFTALRLDEWRGLHAATYRDERRGAGLSGNTVRLELAVLSHLYKIARTEWGHEALTNPINNIRKPKSAPGRDRRLRDGEEQQLLLAAGRELRTIITLAIETAMRRSEMVNLVWRKIDLDLRIATIPETKNGEVRVVPLSPRAIAVLKSWRSVSGGDRVFSYSAWHLSRAFIDCRNRAGANGLRLHDLRHEATSRLFERGLDIMEVAAITGHKSLQQLKRYTHMNAVKLALKLAIVPS